MLAKWLCALIIFVLSIGGSMSAESKPPGKFVRVDPKQTFYEHTVGNEGAPPEVRPLAPMDLGVNDYIGLRAAGDFTIGDIEFSFINGVFANKNGGFLRTGRYGNETPMDDIQCATIDGDFVLGNDRFSILRIPEGARNVVLGAFGCTAAGSTDPDNDYGVTITRPNFPNPVPGKSTPKRIYKDDRVVTLDDSIPDEFIDQVMSNARDRFRTKRVRSVRGLVESIPPVVAPQYRGWYASGQVSSWQVDKSLFCKKVDPRRCPRKINHLGVDIFAPSGSILVAPLGGEGVSYGFDEGDHCSKKDPTKCLGNIGWVIFPAGKAFYTLMFAHLQETIARPGGISKGARMARAGCTGNAGTQWCGRESPEGGRSDHVHVELIKGSDVSLRWERVDPNHELGWNIRCTDQSLCVLP